MAIECEHGRLARKCDTCEDAREIAELRAERDALQRRIAELAEVADERDAAQREIALLRARIEATKTFTDRYYDRSLVLTAERDALRNALRGAVCWMDDDGCDCGVPADQPCALCVARVVLAEAHEPWCDIAPATPEPALSPAVTTAKE